MRASYGQLGEVPGASRRGRRAGCISLVLAATLLVVAGIVLLAVLVPQSKKGGGSDDGSAYKSSSAAAKLCTGSPNPPLCTTVLANAPNASDASPQQWVETFVHALTQALGVSIDLVNKTLGDSAQYSNATQEAFRVCEEVLGSSDDYLATTLSTLHNLTAAGLEEQLDEVQAFLSAVGTGLETCLEELVQAVNPAGSYPNTFNDTQVPLVQPTDPFSTGNSTKFTSDLSSLALYFIDYLTQITGADLPDVDIPPNFPFGGSHKRRLLHTDAAAAAEQQRPSGGWWYENVAAVGDRIDFPDWMQPSVRRALLELGTTKPKKVVSQNGKGDYRRIQDAVDAAPSKSKSIYVIYIAAGTYREQVTIPKAKRNIAFVGAGIDKTIITGFRSVGGGSTTYLSATLAVGGDGFLATGLTISNTAGPQKFQAVALRVSADKVALYRVKLTGFQDTLYAHSLRQFYRECTIVGTVDFIFGNAAAVFQKSTILASTGILGQQNTLTAQGRTDKAMNTGFSFQGCTIGPTRQLQSQLSSYKSYFGRPWKLYSRTTYLGCTVGGIIDPAGWLPWNGTFALNTLFYGEYRNKGPGAGVAKRVPWSTQLTARQTKKFLLKKLVGGTAWLPATGVPFGTTYLG